MGYSRFRPLVIAVALSMTITEFIEVQQLGPEELRTRFRLPRGCDPAVTALSSEPAANHLVTVAVDCRAKPILTPVWTPQPPQPRDRQ